MLDVCWNPNRRWSCCLLLIGAGICGLIGCNAKTSEPKATTDAVAATDVAETVTEIEDQLRSALYQLQPEHLNIDSRLDDAISVLNNWWAAIEAAKLQPSGLSPAAIPTERLTAEQQELLQGNTFQIHDGQHVRACYLARRISEQVASSATSEIARVQQVFDWVCRNIALRDAEESQIPVSFYESLLIGRATPADRAVAIAAILKQLRIDSVVVAPASKEGRSTDDWLLGVILQDQVYLFDVRLGLAVPRGSEQGWSAFSKPATLAEIQQHPEWLDLLKTAVDRPYPLTAEDLKSPQIQAISFLAAWTPRIWAMEQLLPGESLCVLYDPPSRIDQLPGLFDRVAAAFPGVEPSQIELWGYPAASEAALRAPEPAVVRALQIALVPFIVPIEFERDPDTGEVQRIETMRQLRIRTEQLFGRRNDAVAQFVTIRQLSIQQPPEPNLGPIYQRAADDAFFWSCVCKFENAELDSAERLLTDYLKRYRRSGQWTNAARSLLAETQFVRGNKDGAQQTLGVRESDDPYRDRLAILSRVWLAPTP